MAGIPDGHEDWRAAVNAVHPYAKGSWGPKEADRLLLERGQWHDPAG